jgi:hypothetical protein
MGRAGIEPATVTEQVKTLRTSGMERSVNVRENPVHPEDPVHPSYRPRASSTTASGKAYRVLGARVSFSGSLNRYWHGGPA